MLDDDVLARQLDGAARECDSRDHRQKFGRQPDRQRDSEQKRVDHTTMAGEVQRDHNQDEDDDGAGDENAERANAALEFRLGGPGAQVTHDFAKDGLRAGRDDGGGCAAADDGRAEEDVGSRRPRSGSLLDRHRLAGQGRFLHVQPDRLDEPRVGRHEIASGDADQVSRHDQRPRQLAPDAVALDGRRRSHGAHQRIGRTLRSVGLSEVQDDTEQDDRDDERRVDRLADENRHDGCHQQDIDQGVEKEPEQLDQRRCVRGGDDLVAAVAFQPLPRLGRRQTRRIARRGARARLLDCVLAGDDGFRRVQAGSAPARGRMTVSRTVCSRIGAGGDQARSPRHHTTAARGHMRGLRDDAVCPRAAACEGTCPKGQCQLSAG